jgi:hypothetical protein
MAVSIFLCKFIEALMQTDMNTVDLAMVVIITVEVMMMKIPIQKFRGTGNLVIVFFVHWPLISLSECLTISLVP